ncbi:Uncharacterised protein [Mycobacteroides abscessus subsp. abscessus]|nr:Uncharacterised protein [Mycobacteroides abscessus subsp. abscessus]
MGNLGRNVTVSYLVVIFWDGLEVNNSNIAISNNYLSLMKFTITIPITIIVSIVLHLDYLTYSKPFNIKETSIADLQ